MTRDDIIRMAREAGLPTIEGTGEILGLYSAIRFAALIAAAEREECAKVCEQWEWANNAAEAIRARGQA